ncbi:uncharacterized protein LOC132952828 [Metopolophium dirhodum]|uniref:uncharacterized protein LOC132952828 n=1 Tax=Metopolophium dirhodum TaxID=44670 RepID=UPI00299062EE|nr:uncharacterized protein LOC132952828 [Metopolophium dirhodum]
MLEMKCLLIISLVVFVTVVISDTGKPLFLPNLPVGKYRLNFLALLRCTSARLNNKIKYELYLGKKSANTTEFLGNITHLVPFDDSLNLEFDMARKDSVGGWKNNDFVYKSPKGCTTLKTFFGGAWTSIMDGLGIYNATCPIPVGFYKGSGLDTADFMLTNFPKTFFYGTYRFTIYFTKNNEVYGCFTLVVEVKRPWELD